MERYPEYVEALALAIEVTRDALIKAPHPIAYHGQKVHMQRALEELHAAHKLLVTRSS